MTPISDGPFGFGSDTWPGLAKVGEECSELGEVAMKLVGNGGSRTHFDGTDLGARLVEEIGDVQAALDYFLATNDIDKAAVAERRARKLALFWDWHDA